MDKNTVLAVVLSILIIIVGFSVQAIFFPPEPAEPVQTAVEDVPDTAEQLPASTYAAPAAAEGSPGSIVALGDDPSVRSIQFQTEVFDIVFDADHASISEMKLRKHVDDGVPVDMIFTDSSEQSAFKTYFGHDTDSRTDYGYHVTRPDEYTVQFSRDFGIIGDDGQLRPGTFTLTKTFVFMPEDYLFELYVELRNNINEVVPLNYGGYSYTLEFGPQIGPEFYEAPDGRYEYRRFYTLSEGKKSEAKLRNNEYELNSLFSWAALTGKYFTVIGIPDATNYTLRLRQGETETIPLTSYMMFLRPAVRSSVNTDVFRFYMGPQQKQELALYNSPEDNGFGLKDLQLEKAMDASTWFGWLENVLKWLLGVFYLIVPNYGVAIILLTILIKVVLFPFTRKSFQSTSKMAALNPQMQEIREKYKDNPTKMNQELSELYKREKVNPMGGCLPMLLQFPVFIALYGLLNKHFELRGAVFIPGWISDLSAPESIWNFSPVNVPFIGSDLRLLPILYVATMVFSMKVSQTGAQTSGTGAGMNKMFTYVMPAMFFFILYNAPSGLILYWTVMNLFTILQQQVTNKLRLRKGEHDAKKPDLKVVPRSGKQAGQKQTVKPPQKKKKR
jgi:YidC/Oxa1 family membrane protein insertase